MVKAKKLLSVLLAAVLICFTLFSTIPARAAAVPVVKMVTQPSAEYNVGDRVKVQFNCPNYPTKRIQYRAFLWQVGHGYAQEIYKDYAKDGYFYKPVCVGKSVFTIDVFYPQRPGTYYIVVLAKPKEAKKYTSYIYTKTFTVKEKTPTVSVLDEEGKIYGSSDSEKPAIYDTDVKLTAKNITLKNASLSKDLYITGDNCTISNASVKGTIYIDPGKNGSANLNNVKADKIKVLSGGQDSIHLLNVTASVLSVDNSSTDSPVRIESDGTTTIDTTVVGSYSIIDNKSGNFGTIEVKKNKEGKLVVEFRGTFSQPVTVTDGAVIKAAEDATISKLIIAAENKDDKVTLEGSFNTVEISKKANIELSEGTKINTFNANANTDLIADENTKIETIDKENNEVNITGAGAGSVIYKPVTPPSGGGGYVTIPVGSITVTSTSGADAITTKNGTLQMIAAVMPAYATNKNVSWSVINGTGSASIDSSGLLKAITNGTVTVKAKAKDGSGVYGEKEIKISGQIYIITKAYVIGGTANVTLDNDKAATGETVTVEISEIETGKQFKSISVTDVSGDVAVKEVVSGSEYTFTMPDEPVTVSVTLDNIPVVVCPPLVNGLSFLDDNSNDTNTIIKLGVLSDAGDTFVYKISDDDSAVPTPNAGDDLSLWTPVTNGTSITAANGKHIGVAEVKNNIAVQFSDATAVTENENPPDLSVDNINIINQHTITFKSIDVDSIKVDDVDVAMSGTTAPYAEYANGTYTVNLAEPLTVGSHTITLTKSGYPAKTVTAGYFGKIERDPGNTGGNVTAVINNNTITFSGEVAFYGADDSLGRTQGHRVGVKVTAPAGMTDVKGTATLTIGDKTYAAGTNWMDGDNYFYYYPLVTKAGQVFTFTVKWDGTDATADVFTIKIDENAALEGEVDEPNNDISQATAITVNADAKTQWIYPSTDEDWFKFEAQAGTLYKIQTSNLYPDPDDNMSYEVDTVIYLYDKDGNKLDENDDDASDTDYGCGSRIDFLCNESGTYYVKVVDINNTDPDVETQDNYVGRYDIAVTQLTGVTAVPTIQEIAVDNNNVVTVKGTSEAGARVFLTVNNNSGNNICYCYVLADNSGNWEFTESSLSVGNSISVTAVSENKGISTEATATIIDLAQDAVSEVAAGITTIIPPEKDATSLTLPAVPEGYSIVIKSSSNINWVTVGGTVIPQKFPCVVSLVLTVTNTSTGRCANTSEITVFILQSSLGDQIVKITPTALGTITVGDALTILGKAQALVSDGYTVTVKTADGICINASGAAIAAGNGSITFTVAQDAGKINPADTNSIAITVNAASNQDQDAPTELAGVAPTTDANNDGKITRTTTAMEYKLASADDSTYAACGNGETAGLAAGTYDVRYAAKPGFNAGAAVNIIIPYNVASAGDLDNVRNDLDGNYIQTADIDLSTYSNWNPIGTNSNSPFSGSYNGNGYKISNLTASGSTYIGLFGYVRGQIKNVKLDNVTITATYDSVGSYDIGGLAGHLEGTIKNSYITGCNVKGYSNVGGLVGCNWQGSVEECSATGLVSTVADTMGKDSIGGLVGRNKGYIVESLAAVDVSGSGAGAGGLVGINGGGTIDKCYATGSVTTTEYWVGGLVGDNRKFNGADSIITESYAVGTVSGGSSGGLVGLNDGGRNDAGTIETSYYDEDTTTKSDTGKGIQESTLDMMKQATFSGWDFINTWTINEGATYPVFLMEN